MTLLDAAPITLPARPKTDDWQVGDIVPLADGGRWKIRALNRKTGRVVLQCTNRIEADIWWNTELDKLPRRNA